MAITPSIRYRLPAFTRFVSVALAIAIGLFVSGSDPYPFQRGLPIGKITIGEYSLIVEVATTPDQWWRGLSFRKNLAEDRAMLFVFATSRHVRFSVRNTLIPLSLAFIDETGTILEIKPLERKTSPYVASSAKVRFAIEANAGWFSERGIVAGDQLLATGYIPPLSTSH